MGLKFDPTQGPGGSQAARDRQSSPAEEARYQLNLAAKRKEVEKPTVCENCGEPKKNLDGHHDDYSKPTDVRWLCPKCHAEAEKTKTLLQSDRDGR